MKPVFQTIYGDRKGNCFPACIASVLEMDLEDIPNFCPVYKSYWQEELNKWLHQFGLGSLTVMFQDVESPIQKGWCFAAGPCGPEGVMHSVVMKDMKMVHNPHEGWGELDRIVDYTFFVVLDPVKYLKTVGSLKNLANLEISTCEVCDGSGAEPGNEMDACRYCGGYGENVEMPQPQDVHGAREILAEDKKKEDD